MEQAAAFLQHWHYLGLFLLILAEEGGIPLPVPGDVFIAAMGFLAARGAASFPPTAAIVIAATVAGASVLYALSRRLGRPLLLRVARRLGYTPEREERVEAWVRRRGPAAIVVGRLVPGLRIVMTVAVGVMRVDGRVFVSGTALAAAVWATLYFWLGWAAGHGWDRIAGPRTGGWPFLGALAAAGAAVLAWRVLTSRHRLARAGELERAGEPAKGREDPSAG